MKLLIAALLVLAVAANFGEVEESGRFGDLVKRGVQKIAPHVKDIAREVAPVLKEAIKNKIKQEISKRLQLDEVEESQSIYTDMRYRPRYNLSQYRPTWNRTWEKPYRPVYNRTWDRYRPDRYRPRWNMTYPRLGRPEQWNFLEDEVEQSQWQRYDPMNPYRPRPNWNLSRWNISWNRPNRPIRYDPMNPYRPRWNTTWEYRPTWNQTWRRNRTNPWERRNNWNFVEEVEESQWGEERTNWREERRRPRRNNTWDDRRRRNTTWDDMYRPYRPRFNQSWESRPRRNNRTDRWNQTRRNRTNRWDFNRRPPINRWNFVEETEESQWGPRDWEYRNLRNLTGYPYRPHVYRPIRNTSWGMPVYDRPVYRPRPNWYNQTWRRPQWNLDNVRFEEEIEESQGKLVKLPLREGKEGRDRLRDKMIKDGGKKTGKDGKKGGKDTKKGGQENKGWWRKFPENKPKKDETGKPFRPVRPGRPQIKPTRPFKPTPMPADFQF